MTIYEYIDKVSFKEKSPGQRNSDYKIDLGQGKNTKLPVSSYLHIYG